MAAKGIQIEEFPRLTRPLLIASFEGWGNALNISSGMASYLIRYYKAHHFAKLDPDAFYRYDESRPIVIIEEGALKDLTPPGGGFYSARTGAGGGDLVILKADEPSLRWFHFVDEFLDLCETLEVKTVITLGSMYDNVLHSDRIISGIASSEELAIKLKQKKVQAIDYQGPSAIHSIIQSEGPRRGFQCMSLWCHCPYYLQGTIHFGMLAHLGSLLSFLGEFELNTQELEASWGKLNDQIQELINNNPELQNMIKKLRKDKVRGSAAGLKGNVKKDEKVIDIQEFLDPK
ncbi:MAG: PAC2 family protein [Desulfobacterales bacterium]|nr:MAG: PAC2 family protein [Desulfobacterales bacterium]